MSCHLRRGVTRGCHGFNPVAGICLCGLDEDLPEVGEPDETEDMFQILALLIPAFCAGTRSIRAAASADRYERFARDEPFVTFPWV